MTMTMPARSPVFTQENCRSCTEAMSGFGRVTVSPFQYCSMPLCMTTDVTPIS